MQSGACRGAGGLDLRMIKGIPLQASVFFLNLEMRSSIENYMSLEGNYSFNKLSGFE